MNAGQHLGNTKAILESLNWFTDSKKISYFQVLNWSPDYLSLIDIVGKFVYIGLIDYIPFIFPFLGRPLFNFFSMRKRIEKICNNTILESEIQMYHRFHFDSLNSFETISNYWFWLEEVSKLWIKTVSKEEDEDIKQHKLISLLAQTLHVVQDFYSHSNWIEYFHDTYNYSKVEDFPTWFDIFKADDNSNSSIIEDLKHADIHTGYFPIGKDLKLSKFYHNDKKNKPGLNKDRSERPYFDVVYYLAWKNGIQWLNYLKDNFFSDNLILILNKPLGKEYEQLAKKIQPYIKKIAFKVREWNGTEPFHDLKIQLLDPIVFDEYISFTVKLTVSEKLIKYDRDFRKSFFKFILRSEEKIIANVTKFGNKKGFTKFNLKINNLTNYHSEEKLFLKVKYGLLIDEKLIVRKN